MFERLRYEFFKIRTRLLVVNAVVLLVPLVGLEAGRYYERQLLDSLERDLRNQAVLVRSALQMDLARSATLEDARHESFLVEAARDTRTRVRILGKNAELLVDSHAHGPPEGPEPHRSSIPVPTVFSERARKMVARRTEAWPEMKDRVEIREALSGRASERTRISHDWGGDVYLFLSEPIRDAKGDVQGVVYITRSTRPVLVELHAYRRAAIRVLIGALVMTSIVTLLLAWSISRPVRKLSEAARKIASGESSIEVPVLGTGEIRILSEALSEMTKKLDSRMRYISDFAADVAHEFKSPLTSIRGAAELLREGAADDAHARERFLTNIELDTQRLTRLVDRLLELSRLDAQAEPKQLFDFEELLRSTIERHRSDEHAIALNFDAPRWMRGRPAALQSAIKNLLENAIRFSPKNAPIDVRVTTSGSSLELRVSDRGKGIAPELLPKIFDRFFTTERDGNGTGLGLAIVKSVVESHGGHVLVSSVPNEGATFTIQLPIEREKSKGRHRTTLLEKT